MLQQRQSPLNQCPRNTHSMMMGFHSFGYLQCAGSVVIPKPKMSFLLVVDLTDLNTAEGIQAREELDLSVSASIAALTQHQTSHLNSYGVAFSIMVFFSRLAGVTRHPQA